MTKKKESKLKIKYVVSFIGCPIGMRECIRGLGFRKLHQTVEHDDTPEIRGMILKVRHLVEVTE
jgi:large subunit ribosomal protein L30